MPIRTWCGWAATPAWSATSTATATPGWWPRRQRLPGSVSVYSALDGDGDSDVVFVKSGAAALADLDALVLPRPSRPWYWRTPMNSPGSRALLAVTKK